MSRAYSGSPTVPASDYALGVGLQIPRISNWASAGRKAVAERASSYPVLGRSGECRDFSSYPGQLFAGFNHEVAFGSPTVVSSIEHWPSDRDIQLDDATVVCRDQAQLAFQ